MKIAFKNSKILMINGRTLTPVPGQGPGPEPTVYIVTITQPSHGTITAPASAEVGSTVTMSCTPDTGYALQYFTVNGSQIQGNSFVMPASNVTVSALTAAIEYTISVTQSTGGTITAPQSAQYGSLVILSSTADSGYELQNYTVDGTEIVGNTFTMPAHNVTVSAVFESTGPVFDEVTIGNQTWMAKNLNIDDGGEGIYHQTVNYGQGNVTEYYYTYEAAARIASSIPGWHLPSKDEFNTLITTAGGIYWAGGRLKSTYGWSSGNGTNDYGFTVLPTGYCRSGAEFSNFGTDAYVWTNTEYSRYVFYGYFDTSDGVSTSNYANKSDHGYSVRLIKDS